MYLTRHRTSCWIKNNSIDISVKEISGNVSVHWHEFYEIELILSGDGTYSIDGTEYPIKRGALFFMSPSSFHKINFTSNTTLINIMFTLDACDPTFLYGLFEKSPHIKLDLSSSDMDLLNTLANQMVNTKSEKYLSACLNCFLAKLQSIHKTSLISESNPMQYALLYIQNHFTEKLSLNELAKMLNYSPNYLSNKFTQYTGISFKTYIMNLRFTFCLSLLKNSDFSISEICIQSGFEDFSNFMKYFKKRYGITPKQYREKTTKKSD
jgi:YesN/AraC family two-component response regulator